VNNSIDVHDVSFAYERGGWKLEPVSFSVPQGQILAITGPNGSGKSTLLKTIAGLQKPASGRISIEGGDLHKLGRRELARIMGYLPQEVYFEFDFTVEQVVSFGRFAHAEGFGFLDEEDCRAVEEAMGETGVKRFRHRPLSQLSGGERKRVFLASVLAQQPRILLLDEPTASLDMEHGLALFEILNRLADDGMTVLVVSHDLNLASLFASNILLLDDGKCVIIGDPSQVIDEAVLGAVYGDSLLVVQHPQAGFPAVMPRWRGGGREGES